MKHWRLLLTRPAKDCEALAAVLAEQGVHSACMPLLAIRPLPETPTERRLALDLDRYCAVIVVSKTAARLGLERLNNYWPQLPLGLAWFSVGAATAALLEQQALRVEWPTDGDDSEALFRLPALQRALQVPEPRLLILRGEGGRDWLADNLRSRGVQVDYLQLYRRELPTYPAGDLLKHIQQDSLNALSISSGQGLQHLYQLAAEDWPTISALTLFVPSARVAEMAKELGARRVIDCRGASATALLAALKGADENTI